MKPGKNFSRQLILTVIWGFLIASFVSPVFAQAMRDFQPLPRGEMYNREFLADFFDAMGHHPENLSWVDESESVRLLVTAGSMAERGDTLNAISTLALLPDLIATQLPFLTTMKEDLLIPEILDPWYNNEDARTYLFTYYEEAWLPHPEYRDDYISFRDDTMGRASRRDPTVPAVWILGHLSDYGFVPDRQITDDDPYLFLWDLLTSVTVYAQRCGYYGVQWDQYNELAYKRAVVMKVGEKIRNAHDEAARREVGRGFWSDLISSHHPFDAPTQGIETTGEVTGEEDETGVSPASHTTSVEEADTNVRETSEERDNYELFRPPPETEESAEDEAEASEEIEGLIENLEERVEDIATEEVEEEEATEVETEETDAGDTEVTEEDPFFNEGLPGQGTEETEDNVEPFEIEEVTEQDDEEIPDEFLYEGIPDRTPSETMPESLPPSELGNYASVRLQEIADQLAVDIGALANDLGRETIDLVILYNDVNITDETITNAEQRYIAKREAFLAGLAVWDRFDMEIYTPLTLADFNDLVAADLNSPYEGIKADPAGWQQILEYEAHFDEAFAQIENGLRNRRDEEDVLAAEAAALIAFLGDYNDLIKEIEDLLSGAVIEPSEPEAQPPE